MTFIEQYASIRNKSSLCGGGKRAGGDKEMHWSTKKGVAAERNDQAGGKGALSDEGRKEVDGGLSNEDGRTEVISSPPTPLPH